MSDDSIKFVHKAHINPAGKPKPAPISPNWGMLAAGLAAGFLGMYFTVTKPMSERIAYLESDIAVVQTEMHQLVGTRDDLWKTNDLLTGLRQQQRQLKEAQAALVSMRNLKNEVIGLQDQQLQAFSSLQDLASLQRQLIDTQMTLTQSKAALEDVATFQQDVIATGMFATEQQDKIAATNRTLKQVEQLTSHAIAQSSGIESAQAVLNSVDELSGDLVAKQDSLSKSLDVIKSVDRLNEEITTQATKLPSAATAIKQFQNLQDTLVNQDPTRIKQAEQNLVALTNMGHDLSHGGQQITAAINTIELLEDFQMEFARQAESLSGMRQSLMEITFMEAAFERSLEVLKPLIQLSDMRRMSTTEVREAARVILDRRIAAAPGAENRVADRVIPSPVMTRTNGNDDEKRVPTPTDVE